MPSYKLVTYQSAKGPRAGVVVDDKLFDAAALTRKPAYASVLDILNDWASAKAALRKAAAAAGKSKLKSRPVAKAKLLAPVLWPSAIYCAGANYTDHMMEMAKLRGIPPAPDPHEVGLKPWHFIKASRTVTGQNATVKLPKASNATGLVFSISMAGSNAPQRRIATCTMKPMAITTTAIVATIFKARNQTGGPGTLTVVLCSTFSSLGGGVPFSSASITRVASSTPMPVES